jgi:hypothetical protein
MADLAGFLIDKLITLNSIPQSTQSLTTVLAPKTSSTHHNNSALTILLIFANLFYLALMLLLLCIYAKIKKDRRDYQLSCTNLTVEEKQAGWTSTSNFLFL